MGSRNQDLFVERARRMRKHPTLEESKLWQQLRKKRIAGLRFRRQHILFPFIVDFYCAARKLAIEIDGGSHWGRSQIDAQRDAYIWKLYQVRTVRIRAEAVETNLEGVLEYITSLVTA